MNYATGELVKLGDKVRLGPDSGGVVVFIIDSDEYSPNYPKAYWGGYLTKGAMVHFPSYGLIHYEEMEEDLQLIARAE
jgi:hypothetical protein